MTSVRYWLCTLVAAFLAMPVLAVAQAAPEEAPRKMGAYTVTQSLEFGYRYTDVEGAQYSCPPGSSDRSAAGFCQNQAMYNTLVNLQTGPRLLEQTLSLRAPTGHGGVFDHLFVNTFGFGGDPNQAARLRIGKQKAYDLKATYRRDQNFFDYNLLANPLNPGTLPDGGHFLTPGIGRGVFIMADSPHSWSTVRRMTDVDLIVKPQSAVSLRLGYSRVRVEGPSGWTFHMPRGTDINPLNNWNNTTNLGRAGLDFRMLPKTTISLDFFYMHSSISENAVDQNLTTLNTAGQLADFGISWNQPFNFPCAPAALFTPTCNQALSYNRSNRWSSTAPTGQISLQSHAFKRVDLSGRYVYSHMHADSSYQHFWNGKTGTARQEQLLGTMNGKRDSSSADAGATIHLGPRFRILDSFRWINWRIPVQGLVTTNDWLPGSTTPTIVPVPVAPTTTTFSKVSRFRKQASTSNQVELEFDATRAAGAFIGYRYEKRTYIQSQESFPITSPDFDAPASGIINVDLWNAEQPINTGLGGIWVRPSEKFRASFDAELSSLGLRIGGPVTANGITTDASGVAVLSTNVGSGALNRITPRKRQQYRLRVNYNPRPWAVISATGNYLNETNDAVTVDYAYRNRNYGIAATLTPRRNYAFEIAYNYNLLRQSDFICLIDAAPNTPTFLVGSSVTSLTCPFDVTFNAAGVPTGTTGTFQTVGNYHSTNQFFSALWRGKVLPRVTVTLGYSITSNSGDELLTNPLFVVGTSQVLGTLQSSFHRPLAGLEVDVAKNVSAKLGWNYYGYNEKGAVGPTIPRDFHSNSGTVSLKYAF